ncbi:MAG TPA: putative phage tail protein [Rhodopila sp.]|jgi:uncharacterized protein YmfQ (DUF2313 family)|nr:putative phage tail protein [Rhodopila sp.]
MPIPSWTASDFLGAFIRLLPRGAVWTTIADAANTNQGLALEALMPTYVRSAESAAALLVDAFPATTDQLLPEWQATLGLPGPCAGSSPTLQQSQAQVVARLTGRGKNQSQAFYINFAKNLGYDITITQFIPARAGILRAGTPAYGIPWAFAWQVNAPSVTVTYFRAGRSAAGEALSVGGNNVLQCELTRLAPAHTTVLFNFGSA